MQAVYPSSESNWLRKHSYLLNSAQSSYRIAAVGLNAIRFWRLKSRGSIWSRWCSRLSRRWWCYLYLITDCTKTLFQMQMSRAVDVHQGVMIDTLNYYQCIHLNPSLLCWIIITCSHELLWSTIHLILKLRMWTINKFTKKVTLMVYL